MEQFIPDENGLVTVHIETIHELLDDLYVPRNPMEHDELDDDPTPFSLEERMVLFQESINDHLHLAFQYEKSMIESATKYMKYSNANFKERVEFYRLQRDVQKLQEEYDKLKEEIKGLEK